MKSITLKMLNMSILVLIGLISLVTSVSANIGIDINNIQNMDIQNIVQSFASAHVEGTDGSTANANTETTSTTNGDDGIAYSEGHASSYVEGADSINAEANSEVISNGNVEGTASSEGNGDSILLGSGIHIQVPDGVYGNAGSYASGDQANTESASSAENGGGYNSIDAISYANAIGDAYGHTWAHGWSE